MILNTSRKLFSQEFDKISFSYFSLSHFSLMDFLSQKFLALSANRDAYNHQAALELAEKYKLSPEGVSKTA